MAQPTKPRLPKAAAPKRESQSAVAARQQAEIEASINRGIEKMDQKSGCILGGVLAMAAVILIALFALPQYRVYSQRLSGEAALAEAQSSRQVAVLEARAKLESAKALADAEVLRAEGAAKANRILQNSLGGPNGYLRYLQIQALESSKAQLIYVPTEAGLPVTESRRFATPSAPVEE